MTLTPAATKPASSADSNMYPDSRVSLPISTAPPCGARTRAAALASRKRKVHRHGVFADPPPDTVRPEVDSGQARVLQFLRAAATRTASTVAATSWARTMMAPFSTATVASAILPARRSSFPRPVSSLSSDLRDRPTRSGRPRASSWSAVPATAADYGLRAFQSRSPDPGTGARRQDPRPAQASRRDGQHGANLAQQIVVMDTASASSRARPACASDRPPPRFGPRPPAHRANRSARTSLIMAAPASTACSITSGRLVSTEISSCARPAPRREPPGSLGAVPPPGHAALRPGRVDSPPMSTIFAPSAAIACARSSARAGSR